ncbi:hypothetical protein [Corallococcus sp. CA049B]|uniref:hypothetical protein n=1 Tax=Corallococcus sp. CA049B TaxID=2316730 RepID=UPI0011C34E2D|nr:hypothetical protein [Corallococcus sp. CA049B]
MKKSAAEMPAEVALGFLDNQMAVDILFLEAKDTCTFQALMRDLLMRKYGDPNTAHRLARQHKRMESQVRFSAKLAMSKSDWVAVDSLDRELASQGGDQWPQSLDHAGEPREPDAVVPAGPEHRGHPV